MGDVIVVWFIYALILTFFDIKNKFRLATYILLFSFAVETAQYFHIAEKMGFEQDSIMYILIGNSFS